MPSIALGSTLVGPKGETFNITDFLGQGAFGEVYRAVGQETGMVVAVKLLPVGKLASPESEHALLNEVKASQQIRHVNVVEILHVNDGSSSQIGPYVVMEYVSGGTLLRVLKAHAHSGTQIPMSRAIEMMIDIAQGARAINARVIHRDIKPDNILIEGNTLKIGDFGISKFVDESTRLQTFKGGQHIAYMAPEAWQDQANTFKLDVYSVGLVFYQLVTLKHPLLDKVKDPSSFLDWQNAHLFQQCPNVRTIRSDVPLSIAQLLSRMVAKRPDERPVWDEALRILSQPEAAGAVSRPAVTAAVQAALARKQEGEEQQLKSMADQRERTNELELYRYSCDKLLEDLQPVVEEFNQQFQHGQITIARELGSTFYRVPLGRRIELTFFHPERGIKIRDGEVIGGGWLGLSQGRSANLVLLKRGPDDLYGSWVICEVKFMALADPRKLIGQCGLKSDTVQPFGFTATYFYDQIQYATGTLHAFTYTFSNDVIDFFANLLHDACK